MKKKGRTESIVAAASSAFPSPLASAFLDLFRPFQGRGTEPRAKRSKRSRNPFAFL